MAALVLADVKQHLRVNHDREDALIAGYLLAAQAWVETVTGKPLVPTEIEQNFDSFCGGITLSYGPIVSVEAVEYIDITETPAVLAGWTRTGSVIGAPSGGWPLTGSSSAVVVRYVAGFAEAPAALNQAVLLHVQKLESRFSDPQMCKALDTAIDALIRPYRTVLI